MKRLLLTTLLSLSLIASFAAPVQSVSLLPSIAHAQAAAPANQPAGQNAQPVQNGHGDECGNGGPATYACQGFRWFLIQIGSLLISLLSHLQAVAGTLLNISVNAGVIHFGNYVTSIGVIDTTWATFRDLANLIFIFGLLFIAIAYILQLEEFGYKKMLTNIILVAVFVNFSLFITKFVIDISNITATEFANAIIVCPGAAAPNGGCATSQQGSGGGQVSFQQAAAQYGVGDAFAKALSLQALFGKLTDEQTRQSIGPVAVLELILFSSLFILICVVVFIAAAIILIARFIVLIFLMVLSPLAFAAMALPWFKGMAEKWWHHLINNAIYAPVFMLLMWFVANVIQNQSFQSIFIPAGQQVGDAWQNVATAGTAAVSSMGVVFYFFVIIGGLVASIWVAKSLSLEGAALGMKLGSMAAFAVPALAGRHTLGRVGGALARSSVLKNWAAGNTASGGQASGVTRFFTRNIGKGLVVGANKAAKGSFDLRSAPGAGQVSGALHEFGFDVGKGEGAGGYEAFVKRQADRQKAFIDSLKPGDEEKDRIKQEVRTRNAPMKDRLKSEQDNANAGLPEATKQAAEAEEKRKAKSNQVEQLEAQLERQKAGGDLFGATQTENEIAAQRQELVHLTQNANTTTKEVERLEKTIKRTTADMKTLSEQEGAAVKKITEARVEGAAHYAKTSIAGINIDVPVLRWVKGRGTVIGGIKAEGDVHKNEQQHAVDTLLGAMKGGGGEKKEDSGGGGGH